MQPVFKDLDHLIHEKKSFWPNNSNKVREELHSKAKCAELRIMHISTILFSVLTATLAFSLCIGGLIAPLTTGHIVSGLIKLFVGAALGYMAYDMNNLRDIVYRTHSIFEDCLRRKSMNTLSNNVIKQWEVEIQQIRENYKKLVIVDTLIDNFWPSTGI